MASTETRPAATTQKVLAPPRNAWYAAAWDHEVNSNQLSARTVTGRPMVLYRTDDDRPVALADACWHRLAPLSLGKRIGSDEVQCPYHGLRFNSAGRCTFMPAQDTINPSAIVPSFPVVERHRFVWVWPGDPTLADPELVPDMHQMASHEWAGDGYTIHLDANFQLVVDNLMDLTHEEFVHASSIGQGELSETDFEITHDERTVTLTRWMLDVEPAPFFRKCLRDKFPGFDGKVDRWQIITFIAPSTICIDSGAAQAGSGAPQGDRSRGVGFRIMNTICPETDRTSNYHWAFMRNYHLDNQSITTRTREAVARVFREDEQMLVAQQKAIDANPDYEFYSLNIDAGGMWSRRLTERMLAAEKVVTAASWT